MTCRLKLCGMVLTPTSTLGRMASTIAAYGGRYIVRGGASETLEGAWDPKRIVILEFPDRTAAKAWWSSHAYSPVKAIRQAAARTELIAIDGV